MAGKIKTQLIIEGKDSTGKAFKGVYKNLNALTASAKKAGVAIATALSVNALSGYVKNSLDAADAASKSAKATGLAVDQYTALQYAAKLGGVGVSELYASLSKFNRTIDEAANGGTKQIEAFSRLGISITDAGGSLKTNNQLFAEVADKFKTMPDGIQKSALAMELFGRSGARLIPMLNGGSESLAELRLEAEALGVVLNDDQAAASEAFNDNLTRLGEAGAGAGNKLTADLLPALLDMSELLIDVNKNTDAFGIIAKGLGVIIKSLATAVIAVGVTFSNLGSLIGASAAAAVSFAKGDFAIAADIMREVTAENEKATKGAEDRIAKLWDGSGDAAAKAAVDAKKSADKLVAVTKSLTVGLKEEQDQQLKNAKDALKERVKIEREASKALDDAKKDQIDTEKRYKEALAGLNAGASGDPTYGAALDLKVSARQALGSGDLEAAKTQAQASLKIIKDLADAGANTYGFAGFVKELQSIEQSADQQNFDAAQAAFDAAKRGVDDLKAQIDQVKDVKITPTMDAAAAAQAKAEVAALADELSKSLVLTPTIATAQQGSIPGYATGTNSAAKGMAWVGERGPELMAFGGGEKVFTAGASKSLAEKMAGMQMPAMPSVSAALSSSGASSLGTVNISLDGKSYSLQADQQNFADLVQRQKWKRGSTRT